MFLLLFSATTLLLVRQLADLIISADSTHTYWHNSRLLGAAKAQRECKDCCDTLQVFASR